MSYPYPFHGSHGFYAEDVPPHTGFISGMNSNWVPAQDFGSAAPRSSYRSHQPQGQERIIPISREDRYDQPLINAHRQTRGSHLRESPNEYQTGRVSGHQSPHPNGYPEERDYETESNISGSSHGSQSSNRSNGSSKGSWRGMPPDAPVRTVPVRVEGRNSPDPSRLSRSSSRSSSERVGSPHLYSSSPSQRSHAGVPPQTFYGQGSSTPAGPIPPPTQFGNCQAKRVDSRGNVNEQMGQNRPDGASTRQHVTRIDVKGQDNDSFVDGNAQQNIPSNVAPDCGPPPAAKKKPTPDEIMEDVCQEVGQLEKAIDDFDGEKGKDSKEFRYLDEMLTRCMLKLDGIDCSGRDDLRQQRKSHLSWINKCLQRLEDKCRQLIPVLKPGPSGDQSLTPANQDPAENHEAAPRTDNQGDSSQPMQQEEEQNTDQNAENHQDNEQTVSNEIGPMETDV